MAAAPGTAGDEAALAAALADLLGGEVRGLHRLSGGASRTTWSFDLAGGGPDDAGRGCILQVRRPGAVGAGMAMADEGALVGAAGRAGVPVAAVLAGGRDERLGGEFLVTGRVAGETIARKVLRDPEYAGARAVMVSQCARAMAAVHAIDPGAVRALGGADQLTQFADILHALDPARPALELGLRRLAATRPAPFGHGVVHGDFRTGNLVVGPDGLRAVLDWELAHLGDPLEDLGWFCARPWRFGAAGRAGGFGPAEALVSEYERATGRPVDPADVAWWEALGTFKWAVISLLQGAAHRSGDRRSVEHAAIGRRVCESEWDLLALLGAAPADGPPAGGPEPGGAGAAALGSPGAGELVAAVRQFLADDVVEGTGGRLRFHARVAANALGIVGRELALGPALVARRAARLARLGFADEAALAAAVRAGACDERWDEVAATVAAGVRDQLLVANPRHLPDGA